MVLANRPDLAALAEHVRSFACTVTEPQSERLPEWIESARAPADLPRFELLRKRVLLYG